MPPGSITMTSITMTSITNGFNSTRMPAASSEPKVIASTRKATRMPMDLPVSIALAALAELPLAAFCWLLADRYPQRTETQRN